jgi:hypothetical protein
MEATMYSFLNALTSSHIFFRSKPRGDFPFAPFPFPDSIPRAVSSSVFTSFASAALRGSPLIGHVAGKWYGFTDLVGPSRFYVQCRVKNVIV